VWRSAVFTGSAAAWSIPARRELWKELSYMVINNGEALPAIEAVVDGASANLADVVAGSWGVVLLYRGHW